MIRKIIHLGTFFMFSMQVGCGMFLGEDNNNSSGAIEVETQTDVIDFSTATSTTTPMKSVPIRNSTTSIITITNVYFENNLCGDFSIQNVMNTSGQSILNSSSLVITFEVTAGSVAYVNVRYDASANCVFTNYESQLIVVYSYNGKEEYASIALKPGTATADGGDEEECLEFPSDFNYTDLTVSGIPAPGDYYLRVDRMAAFIYPTSATGNEALLGTDDVAEVYVPTFLKVTVNDGSGNITLAQITSCFEFILPSADDHPFMAGADTLLTSTANVNGTIDENGVITLSGLQVTLRAEGIDTTESLVANASGVFQASIDADLITGETIEDEFLGQVLLKNEASVMNLFDLDGNDLYNMIGEPLANGQAILVSRAQFTNSSNTFIGSEVAQEIMFDVEKPTYGYLHIEVTFTARGEKITEE